MTPETDFLFKILGVFVAAATFFVLMMRSQKRKQKEADEKYEFVMKMIEMRNKKIGDINEPKN